MCNLFIVKHVRRGLFRPHRPRARSAAEIELLGRFLHVPQAVGGVACFDFDALCRRPLGSADYLEIAERFHTVFVDRIPVLTPAERNEARRFTILVDALYDMRVKLVASVAAEPEALFPGPDGAEAFEFARTASPSSKCARPIISLCRTAARDPARPISAGHCRLDRGEAQRHPASCASASSPPLALTVITTDDERRQGFAFDVFGNDEQRLASLDDQRRPPLDAWLELILFPRSS